MALEKMSIVLDSKLKHEFEKYVLSRYTDLQEGILDLMRTYVERQKAVLTPDQLKQKVSAIFLGDPGSHLNSREIEKIMLNKTDAEIEANRLA